MLLAYPPFSALPQVRGNMFIGLFEKPSVYIMVRVGKERMNEALLKIPGAVPCVCKSGRIFPGTINVPFEHFRGNERLAIIVDLALRHNAGLEAKGPKEKIRPKKPALPAKRKRDTVRDTPCDTPCDTR